jgi:hypothetical protein
MKFTLSIAMAAAEDVETQQKGFAGIYYQSNPQSKLLSSSSEREEARRIHRFFPIRVSSFHVCLPDSPAFSFVKAVAMAATTPEVRTRMRFHIGEL